MFTLRKKKINKLLTEFFQMGKKYKELITLSQFNSIKLNKLIRKSFLTNKKNLRSFMMIFRKECGKNTYILYLS